jgi:hypothetical protein
LSGTKTPNLPLSLDFLGWQMNTFESVNEVLIAVGLRDGIPNFRLNPERTAGLVLKDGTELYVEWDVSSASLFLYTALAEMPADDAQRLSMYQQLLEFNCLSAGGVLSVHQARKKVFLHRTLSTHSLAVQALDQALDSLIAERHALFPLFNSEPSSSKPLFVRTNPFLARHFK